MARQAVYVGKPDIKKSWSKETGSILASRKFPPQFCPDHQRGKMYAAQLRKVLSCVANVEKDNGVT